ncbi:hypothetical protein GF415_05030 [Candidatus Micrarchaeota archaeon]|nr:hypothetical protein [Candidatus Micrarchaeota archaeon]
MKGISIGFFDKNTEYINKIHREINKNKLGSKGKEVAQGMIILLKAVCDPVNIFLVTLFLVESRILVGIPVLFLPITLVSLARCIDPAAKPDSLSRFMVFLSTCFAVCILPFLAISYMPQELRADGDFNVTVYVLVMVLIVNTYRATSKK